MPCYHPLRGVLVERPGGRSIEFSHKAKGKGVTVPCGRCIGCKLERARQWAVRIMHESSMHDDCVFATLTYDPKFYPENGSIDVPTCQLFLKRLRSQVSPVRIRFFLCGEYGELMARAHYHIIIFGYGFPDKVSIGTKNEYEEFRSDLLDKTWGLGFCSFGSVTFDSACYVANYATKKITGPKAKAHYKGRVPEFLLMSRRPGIGRSWIDEFASDVYPSDEVIVRGRQCRPPRFYDEVFKKKHPAVMEAIVEKRELAAEELEHFVAKSGTPYCVAPGRNYRRLAMRERVAKAKLSLKSRQLERS